MIELPDGKISRTLPEQVGFLSEQVKRIFRFLDGINVQDNVVVVDNIATPLTAEELVIVNRDVAFLVYSGQLYIKKSVSGSTAYFDVVFSISAGTTITFNSSEIQVNLSNGGMSLVTNSPATYSKAQIDTLLSAKSDITYVDAQLALKANLSGANFTGAITAPSIIEDMSGYSFSPASATTNLSQETIYAGVSKTGNKITFVIFQKITRTGDVGTNYAGIGQFYIPQAILDRLYPSIIDGGSYLDNRILDLFSSLSSIVNAYAYVSKQATYLSFNLFKSSQFSELTLNKDYFFRYEATFLLSDNLAS